LVPIKKNLKTNNDIFPARTGIDRSKNATDILKSTTAVLQSPFDD